MVSLSILVILLLIRISNRWIYSRTGLTFGISTWFDTRITHRAAIDLSNIYAGYDLLDHISSYEDRPNKAPEACAFRIYSSDMYQVNNIFNQDALARDIIDIHIHVLMVMLVVVEIQMECILI